MHYNPLHWECVETSEGSQKTNRSSSKAPSSKQSSKSCKHLYLSQFPIFLHDYIEDIIDVGCDENYGFCDIAALLGWGEDSWSLVTTCGTMFFMSSN